MKAAAGERMSARAQACVEWLRDYASRRVNSRLIDERRCIPPHVVIDLGNRGLLAMQVPLAMGGKLGLSTYDALKVARQLAAIDLTLAFFCGVNNVLGVRPIWRFASPAVRERHLPDLVAGRTLAAFALTEPGAGSNPMDIKATAGANGGGGFLLNGTKVWSGNAGWSSLINVIANQVSVDGRSIGHVALCVSTDLKGVRQGPEALTTGVRGMVQNSVFLEGVQVGSDHLLGQPGAGLAVASDSMMAARHGIAATCVGGMWRALQIATRYAQRRTIGTARLIESDLIMERIAGMHAAAQAADGLVDQMARDVDDGVAVPPEAYAAVKALSSEWLGQAVDAAIQTLGGRGYIETNGLPQMARDARLARIFEGPTDTLLMYVGQRLLGESAPLLAYVERLADAAALRRHVESARERLADKAAAKASIHAALGQLGALHLAKACAGAPPCAAWLDVQIARAAAELERGHIARIAAGDVLRELAHRIGDIEQAAPDEDRALDRYFRREFAA